MKITEKFGLKVSEYVLDFYNVDLDTDNKKFIDPYVIKTSSDPFLMECEKYIELFFNDFILQLKSGAYDVAKGLFLHLHEVNNTRLGMSNGEPKGKAIGALHADQIFNAILRSDLFTKGIANEFADIRLFIKYIDKDKMSDMVTNIIKEKLAEYTNQQCKLYGIPVSEAELEVWSYSDVNWVKKVFYLPKDDKGKYLLFVPKVAVDNQSHYTFVDFLYKSILTAIKEEYIANEHPLVKHKTLKDGSEKLTLNKNDLYKSLSEEGKINKDFAVSYTKDHPEILNDFKKKIVAK